MDDLALKVGWLDTIEVAEHQGANAAGREVHRGR